MYFKRILLGIIISIGIVRCEKENDKSLSFDTFLVSYSKGSSWTGYFYKATIKQNGLMQVEEGNELNEINRESEFNLNESDIVLLKNRLSGVISIDIDDSYGFGDNKPTDLPVTFIFYNVNNKVDSSAIYNPAENELPEELDSFLQFVEQMVIKNDTISN